MKRGFLNKPLYPRATTTIEPSAEQESEMNRQIRYGKPESFSSAALRLPEKYKAIDRSSHRILDPDETNYSPGTAVFTTIPSQFINGPQDPDGHTEWIVRGSTKKKVLEAPGYPAPVPKPKGVDPTYVIRETPDMGQGLFATRKIKAHELIFAERPLVVVPYGADIYAPSAEDLEELGMAKMDRYENMDLFRAVAFAEAERHMEMLFGRMDEENQKAFKALANAHTEDGSGPLYGIIRTNAYAIDEVFDGPELTDKNMYGGVCKIGSRINHSCMYNIDTTFDLASFSFQFTAKRNIDAGEQLFVSYVSINLPASDRAAKLAPYGITKCVCAACTHATPETDKLRAEFENRIEWYQRMAAEVIKSSGPVDESVLEPVLELQEAMVREGLQLEEKYPLLLGVLLKLNAKLGRKEKARMYIAEIRKCSP